MFFMMPWNVSSAVLLTCWCPWPISGWKLALILLSTGRHELRSGKSWAPSYNLGNRKIFVFPLLRSAKMPRFKKVMPFNSMQVFWNLDTRPHQPHATRSSERSLGLQDSEVLSRQLWLTFPGLNLKQSERLRPANPSVPTRFFLWNLRTWNLVATFAPSYRLDTMDMLTFSVKCMHKNPSQHLSRHSHLSDHYSTSLRDTFRQPPQD